MRLLNKNKMYLIISQLCLALTGASFPENVFEDILFYLLQGQRKGRITLGHKVKDFHKMTPFQLCLLGFPRKYYSNGEYHTLNKIKKIFNSEGFIKTFFTHTEAGENHIITPAHISLKTWKGKDNPSLSERWGLGPSTREKNNVCLKIILYFKSLKDMTTVDSLFRRNGFNEKKKYILKTLDISWLSNCVFCGDFMKNRSERVRTSCTDPEDLSRYCNNVHYPISGKTGYEWNSYITGVPICTCCRYSKERQDENRMNMLSQNGENYATPPSHFKNSQEYHRSIARSYPKPDMSHIPKDIKLDWPTPLDYSLTYWNLTDPTESSWGVWFWHPDLSADEYMRYQQYKRNLAIEDARSEMDNRDSTDSTDSWMDSE